jgi:alkylation response protein AidB-like acyl-CoA dehydrogenase
LIVVRGDLETAAPVVPGTVTADLLAMAREIGTAAAPHAARHDRDASFVTEGYEAIRASGFGTVAVPAELGGGGTDLAAVCAAQAVLARYCASTSLAISMHQHNVLTLAWRWRLGDREVEPTLRRIAAGGLILSSSGAADPANPGVTAVPADGGLLVSGRKRFCSGVPGADAVLTQARVDDGTEPWTATVLIPMPSQGAQIIPDWDAMGMRGSGSNPVSFSKVFVPESGIIELAPVRSLPGRTPPAEPDGEPPTEPRTAGHRLPGLQIALAVIASVYLGAAGAMRDRALRIASARDAADPAQQRIAGLLTQEYRSARWALDAYIADTTDDAVGSERHFVTAMLAKRQVVLSSIRVVELAMELLGSRSYLRALPFEQALRDVRAGITHPLTPEKTLLEVGRSALRHFADQPDS